ncbi:Xylem serine proteinase 1 precursor, putative [Ricinus communis]|uniref:Xylem serine proteinase 1, putative n=1 Tax=Ricinus communis TaxID=3988 RepID=B9S8H8_RICCO|nr:Xylem serine proteinase 1 precursor, putative [Ricinus communis]|eukprot:XP_002522297.1 subtilisin-like protease SBT5.6 [Ricinus communis]
MKRISIFFLFLLPLLASCVQKKVYIVYFGEHSGDKALHEIEETHVSYLFSVKETEREARDSLLYSYKNSINGFSALLTPEQASKLSQLEEVKSVIESHPRKYSVQTTRSWEFVGLEEGEEVHHSNSHFDLERELPFRAGYGKRVIVGVMDSGVWPESKSFSDEGMGPIPKSWKGICQAGPGFNSSHCNKKIIGARYYIKAFEQDNGALNVSEDSRSPRDMDGHGTHTASTVAGNRVHDAAAYGGFARGTASGGAPLAHLAIYKACWALPNQEKANGNTCYEADMLAAIDDAIADGVHVLSMSIGTTQPVPYEQDGIAIGAFHAAKKNIVVACAAGNAGPAPSTLSNPAPWIITVGASTVDRAFLGPIVLGNGKTIMGQTVTPDKLDKMYPLVYAADMVAPGVLQNETNQCLPNSLSPDKVKGKIVLCMRGAGMRVGKGMEVKRAGGVGYILGNSPANGNDVSVDAHVLPGTAVTSDQAIEILKYIKSTENPTATIGKAKTVLHYSPAPSMAAFSSRGPNVIDPNILKPDISAPGVNILAAWSGASPPTKLSTDNRTVKFNIDSGTSMACPHVAAAAALLKAIHPTWSSAAIRSAIMTTAWMKNNKGQPITDPSGEPATPFQFGSGQFRPAKAADPGLVYDATYKDYVHYLCNYGLKDIDPKYKCPTELSPAYNLNYPSIAIPRLNGTVTIKRSVRNVGASNSVYFFTAKPPMGFSVKASPSILNFNHVNQKKSFTIRITANPEMAKKHQKDEYAFGWYTWTDSFHYVRSPIAVSLA